MFPKILHWFGLTACIVLVISCFLPWAYYADPSIAREAERTFTGFFSYQNYYGKPGKLLVLLAAVVFIFTVIPKVWAKRANLFICAVVLAYAITNYIRFGSCYNNLCPQRMIGLYLMLASSVVMLLSAVFPKLEFKEERV